MKNLKNLGFTLVEVMVAMGIAGGLAIIIAQSTSMSRNSFQELVKTSNQNTLEKVVNTNMSNPQTCKTNLGGKTIAAGGTLTVTNLQRVYKDDTDTSRTLNFLSVGQILGDDKSKIFKINAITFSRVGTVGNTINLIIDYQNDSSQNVAKTDRYTMPITVYYDPTTPNLINNCFFDNVQNIKDAVKQACLGNMTYYNAATTPYGSCDISYQVLNNAGTQITSAAIATDANYTITCPTGQLLAAVTTPSNQLTLQCKTFTTDISCPADSYLEKVDATGTWTCKTLASLWGANGVIIRVGNTYVIKNISCPVGKALQNFDASGNPSCIDRVVSASCPANQYLAGFDASGNKICRNASAATSCGAGTYAYAVDAGGGLSCRSIAWPLNSCGAGQVLEGWNASGGAICAAACP